jgi:hypothetical protein
LGFLGAGRFVAKTPGNGYWILLDFLGFFRQNLDFSMGYTGFSREKIFNAACPGEPPERGTRAVEVMRICGICHVASLA